MQVAGRFVSLISQKNKGNINLRLELKHSLTKREYCTLVLGDQCLSFGNTTQNKMKNN